MGSTLLKILHFTEIISAKSLHITAKSLHITPKSLHITAKSLHITAKLLQITAKIHSHQRQNPPLNSDTSFTLLQHYLCRGTRWNATSEIPSLTNDTWKDYRTDGKSTKGDKAKLEISAKRFRQSAAKQDREAAQLHYLGKLSRSSLNLFPVTLSTSFP